MESSTTTHMLLLGLATFKIRQYTSMLPFARCMTMPVDRNAAPLACMLCKQAGAAPDPAVGSTGWITHWGEAMANTSAVQLTQGLQGLLSWPASFTLYVFHGGTNWGFTAGLSPPTVQVPGWCCEGMVTLLTCSTRQGTRA